MAAKAAVLSFDDTEEDNIEAPAAAAPAPVAQRPAVPDNSRKDKSRPTSMFVHTTAEPSLFKSQFSKRSDENIRASTGTPGTPKTPISSLRSASAIAKEEKNKMGSWSKITALVGMKKDKRPDIRGKISISGPSNFTHVKSITTNLGDSNRMSKSESTVSLQDHVLSSTSKETIEASVDDDLSRPTVDTKPANDAMSKFNKDTIDDLLTGAYFMKHSKGGDARQAFISCSEDLLQLHVWNSYQDKDEKKAPREGIPVTDVVEIKTGYHTTAFDVTGVAGRDRLAFSLIMPNNRSVDLEAFTVDDRTFWVERFASLMEFLKIN